MSEHQLPAIIPPMTAAQIAKKMSGGHSVFSPSGAEMSMTCLGSLIPNALAEDDTTFDAAMGTVAHGIAEEWIKDDWTKPEHYIGMIEDCRGHEIEIDEEMMGFIGDYIDLCQETAEEADHHFSESHVDISDLTPIPGQGGTMDFTAFWWQHAKIVDLKYGKEPVFAYYIDEGKVNKQLAIYAWGIFLEWDWLYNFQTIELVISQPRLPHGVSRHTMTRQELIDFADFARERWKLAWVSDAPRTPSIRGCRWCKIRATCPANYYFMAEIDDVFENYEDAEFVEIEEGQTYSHKKMVKANELILDDLSPSPFPKFPDPVELSTPALAKLLRYRKHFETVFNAIQAELLTRAISREIDVPWWKVVESRTRRKMVDDEDFVVETLEQIGLERDDIYETKMKSPAGLERTLHTKLKMKLADAKRVLEDGLTVKPPGQKTLAATSDNRIALPKDGDVFENYDEAI